VHRLLKLLAEHPEDFTDDVFLPCPMRQIADLLNEVVAETPVRGEPERLAA
jgi:hypothetical protein